MKGINGNEDELFLIIAFIPSKDRGPCAFEGEQTPVHHGYPAQKCGNLFQKRPPAYLILCEVIIGDVIFFHNGILLSANEFCNALSAPLYHPPQAQANQIELKGT